MFINFFDNGIFFFEECSMNLNKNSFYNHILTEHNLRTKYTGLKYTLWLDPAGENRNVGHHSPRLKVVIDGQKYPVIFYPEVKIPKSTNFPKKIKKDIVKEVCPFIDKNKDIFLKYWNGDIDFPKVENMVKSRLEKGD